MQSTSFNPACNSNIQMTGNSEPKKKRGFFGAVLNSAKNVGMTAAAGVGGGVAAGALISAIPVKNVKGTAEVLSDTFINAAKETKPRPYINPATTGDQFKKAQKVLDVIDLSDAIQKKQALEETKKLINNAKNDKEAAAVIKGLFEGTDMQSLGLKAPKGDYAKNTKTIKAAKDNILKQLDKLIDPKLKTDEKAIKSLGDKYTKAIKALNESAVKYIESASKDDELLKLAKKEAKRVRRNGIIGNAVYVGILTAFAMGLINLLVPKKAGAKNNPNQQAGQGSTQAVAPAPASSNMIGTTQG